MQLQQIQMRIKYVIYYVVYTIEFQEYKLHKYRLHIYRDHMKYVLFVQVNYLNTKLVSL
jgi:hypothetical protein